MTRDDIELYVMGQYDGDVAALERAIADDPALAAVTAEEASLELLLREAGAEATFCPSCDDLVRGDRCSECGSAIRPGGYTVERVLVANAHGRMYVARDADGKQVALKELAFVQTPTLAALAAFEGEAKVLRALEHPAIPRFVASFEEGSGVHLRYYLAQELVDGAALDRLDEHWYSEAEVIALARQVLAILVYLQSLSPMVIHRDVKPANLLRRPDGTIALVDFGAAHVHGTTAGSTTIGTFGYMPLEQLAGEVDATTDGYALGMTMLHLLTRQEPWRIAQEKPTLNVSAALRAFLDQLVAPDRRARFASAKDALAALETLGEGRAKPPRRRWLPAVYAAATAVLALGGFGAYKAMTAVAPVARSVALRPEPGVAVGTAAVRMMFDRPDVAVPLWIDGTRFDLVSDRQEIPVVPGHHHVFVDSARSACIVDITATAGVVTDVSCDVDPHYAHQITHPDPGDSLDPSASSPPHVATALLTHPPTAANEAVLQIRTVPPTNAKVTIEGGEAMIHGQISDTKFSLTPGTYHVILSNQKPALWIDCGTVKLDPGTTVLTASLRDGDCSVDGP